MWRSTWISFILLLASLTLLAQDPPASGNTEQTGTADTEPIIAKEKTDYKPTGLRLGTNIFRLSRSVFSNKRNSWDLSADLDFGPYMLEISYGRESLGNVSEIFDYENSGSFFRIGPEINFIKDKTEGNALLLGLKYVSGNFKEQISFLRTDEFFGNREINLENTSLRSRWAEINLGMKARIWSQLYTGFYFRYRLGLSTDGEKEFEVYHVPGYGFELNNTSLGFDYYLYWRIPFRKRPDEFKL